MSYLYSLGLSLIQDIQSRFGEHDSFFNAVNQVADPSYVFSIIVPIFSIFNTLLCADILMVSVIAEWSNCLLKWLIQEDRPYWWIRESSNKISNFPHIRQNHLTCETSPGNPSGHVMGSAAVLYVLINTCIKHYSKRNEQSGKNKNVLKIMFWMTYVTALLIVSMSRMYAATHFPHQCILGALLGFLIGYYFGNGSQRLAQYWHGCSKLKAFVFVFLATGFSFVVYWLQKALGIDPQWSVKMAFKWCENVENVHVNTTPLFSLVRDTGIGAGLAAVSPIISKTKFRNNLLVSVACVLFYCTALHLAQMAVPTNDAKIFYICHSLLNATIPYVLINFIPKFATLKRKCY